MKLFLAGLVAGAMALSASSAMAVTATLTAPNFAALAPTSTDLPLGVTSFNGTTVSGSLDNVYLSPFAGQAGLENTEYFAAGPLDETDPNPALLVFSGLMSSFSFLWGSPDSFNEITFIDTINTTSITLEALLFGAGYNSSIYTGTGAVFVELTGLLFNQVSFFSDPQAVEFSNISAIAVPIPAGLPLLGAGVALLGFLGMRRKRNIAAA